MLHVKQRWDLSQPSICTRTINRAEMTLIMVHTRARAHTHTVVNIK